MLLGTAHRLVEIVRLLGGDLKAGYSVLAQKGYTMQ
jgi:hypothetical protein